jgi:hypothetical protein
LLTLYWKGLFSIETIVEQGKWMMNEPGHVDVEPPDQSCEQCGHFKLRLVFDHISERLLCETCFELAQHQQAWNLLRQADIA